MSNYDDTEGTKTSYSIAEMLFDQKRELEQEHAKTDSVLLVDELSLKDSEQGSARLRSLLLQYYHIRSIEELLRLRERHILGVKNFGTQGTIGLLKAKLAKHSAGAAENLSLRSDDAPDRFAIEKLDLSDTPEAFFLVNGVLSVEEARALSKGSINDLARRLRFNVPTRGKDFDLLNLIAGDLNRALDKYDRSIGARLAAPHILLLDLDKAVNLPTLGGMEFGLFPVAPNDASKMVIGDLIKASSARPISKQNMPSVIAFRKHGNEPKLVGLYFPSQNKSFFGTYIRFTDEAVFSDSDILNMEAAISAQDNKVSAKSKFGKMIFDYPADTLFDASKANITITPLNPAIKSGARLAESGVYGLKIDTRYDLGTGVYVRPVRLTGEGLNLSITHPSLRVHTPGSFETFVKHATQPEEGSETLADSFLEGRIGVPDDLLRRFSNAVSLGETYVLKEGDEWIIGNSTDKAKNIRLTLLEVKQDEAVLQIDFPSGARLAEKSQALITKRSILFAQQQENSSAALLDIQVRKSENPNLIAQYVSPDPMFGGGFAQKDRFAQYLGELKVVSNPTTDTVLRAFQNSPYGIRFRKAMQKIGVHEIVIDLISPELWDDYDYAFAVRGMNIDEGRLYVSIPSTSSLEGETVWIAQMAMRLREHRRVRDALITEGISYQGEDGIPTITEPGLPGYYILLDLLKTEQVITDQVFKTMAQKHYPYLAGTKMESMDSSQRAVELWRQLPEGDGRGWGGTHYFRDKVTGAEFDINFDVTSPPLDLWRSSIRAYAEALAKPGGLKLGYSIGQQKPFLALDLSELFAVPIRTAVSSQSDADIRLAVDEIHRKRTGLQNLLGDLIKDALESGLNPAGPRPVTKDTKTLGARLAERKIIFESGLTESEVDISARQGVTLLSDTFSDENTFFMALFGALGRLDKIDADLDEDLYEIVLNAFKYSEGLTKPRIDLEFFGGSNLLKLTVIQDNSLESDWNKLLRNKAGFDNKGFAYLQNLGERERSLASTNKGSGFARLGGLMEIRPIFLRLTRQAQTPFSLQTELFMRMPSDVAVREPNPASSFRGARLADVKGRLFDPANKISQRENLQTGAFAVKTPRNASDVRKILEEAKRRGIILEIEGNLRGVDGPGSSLDLPEFQRSLTALGVTSLTDIPSTPTIASDFSVKIRFSIASDPDVVEYIAPDYGIKEDRPFVVRDKVELVDGKTPHGQLDAPAYIFSNVFGLKGIRIELESISPMALAGGMESSNAFNVALLSGASILSGANWSLADIFSEAVRMENDEFKGLTGGQGHLATMLGGSWRHVWLSGVKNSSGELINPYGALSVPFLSEQDYPYLEAHMALVQGGKEYRNGKAVVNRTAALVNNMWTDLLRDNDPIGVELHSRKLGLAHAYVTALSNRDMKEVVRVVNEYVDIRDALQKRWLVLALMPDASVEKPEYAKRYSQTLITDEVLKTYFAKYGQGLGNVSLYSDHARQLILDARDAGIAIMPLGAGGPGANMIAISSELNVLKDFFERNNLPPLNDDGIRQIFNDRSDNTKMLKGYMPFKVGKEPIRFRGFQELGLSEPTLPAEVVYHEKTGKFESVGARLTSTTSRTISTLEGPINPNDAVTFIVQTHSATGMSGKLMLGSMLLDYKENADGSLTIRGLDEQDRTINPSEWKKITLEGGQSALQITVSMSDVKITLEQVFSAIDQAPISDVLNDIKAVEVIDVQGFDETMISVLVEYLKLAHNRPWGKQAKFLLLNAGSTQTEWIPKDLDFIVTSEVDLGEYAGAAAKRILNTTPKNHQKNTRHLFMKPLQEGDIPNLGMIRASLSLARVSELKTTNPEFMQVMHFVGLLLGIDIKDASEFIRVTEHPEEFQNGIPDIYALPAAVRLAINQIVQGARLAAQLIRQSA